MQFARTKHDLLDSLLRGGFVGAGSSFERGDEQEILHLIDELGVDQEKVLCAGLIRIDLRPGRGCSPEAHRADRALFGSWIR